MILGTSGEEALHRLFSVFVEDGLPEHSDFVKWTLAGVFALAAAWSGRSRAARWLAALSARFLAGDAGRGHKGIGGWLAETRREATFGGSATAAGALAVFALLGLVRLALLVAAFRCARPPKWPILAGVAAGLAGRCVFGIGVGAVPSAGGPGFARGSSDGIGRGRGGAFPRDHALPLRAASGAGGAGPPGRPALAPSGACLLSRLRLFCGRIDQKGCRMSDKPSFFSRLFGGKSAAPDLPSETYEGFTITPEPVPEGGRYRIGARIEKEVDGTPKSHHLIRADVLDTLEAAAQASVGKARQMIDEQGERLFG